MSISNKFPSFDLLYKSAVSTFIRFPLVLVSAFVGSIVAIDLVDFTNPPDENALQKLLMAAALGLPLFIALSVFAEKRQSSRAISYSLQLGGALLLVVYYFSLPGIVSNPQMHFVRFMLLNIGLHFLVASLPFLGGDQIRGFWQLNKSLAMRFLTAAIYSSVMYIGLAIALGSADHLFGFDVKDERYLQLWIVIAGVFNTWVFLAGVPSDLEELNSSSEYPKGLMVFTRYILLPLVALYFVILFSYELKIIFTLNWPKGWVSQLVLWYSVVGILSLLLMHPLRERLENRWINVFSRWFFLAMIPLVAMLFLAITRRISDYGITENRYFVLGMAIGLFVVVLYFVFSKVKDIRIIPLVLCVGALISAYGPWSAFSVSEASQQTRLEKILVENEILVEGSIKQALGELTFEDRKEMSSIISYLSNWHGIESFEDWFSKADLDSLKDSSEYSLEHQIAGMMGFEYISRWQEQKSRESFRFSADSRTAMNIKGYDYMLNFVSMSEEDSLDEFMLDYGKCFLLFDHDQSVFSISLYHDSVGSESATKLSLYEPLKALLATTIDRKVEQDQLTFPFSDGSINAKIVFDNISGTMRADSLKISYMSGQVLLRLQ